MFEIDDSKDALINEGDCSADDSVRARRCLAPHLCCVAFKKSWIWRRFMSLHSSYVACVENSDPKRAPEVFRSLSGFLIEVRPSPGCGLGAFAVNKIPANQFLDLYGGELKTETWFGITVGAYVWEVGEAEGKTWFIDGGNTKFNWTRYMNHSNKPNIEPFPYPEGNAATYSIVCDDGSPTSLDMPRLPRVEFWTLSDIQPGEELRFDYGEEYEEELRKDLKRVGRELV